MIATLQKEDSSKTITKILTTLKTATTMKTAKVTIITPFSKKYQQQHYHHK
jgi:hypothetical protein